MGFFSIISILSMIILINVQSKEENLVSDFTKETGSTLFGSEYKYFCVLLEAKDSEDYDDHYDEFQKAARQFKGEVKFVYINTDIEENWEVIEYLGMIADDIPCILFIDLEKGLTKYKSTFKEITKKAIIGFTKDCIAGHSVPHLKSEEIPDGWDDKPVKKLVGKSFDQVVFGSKKTSFIFFYASWCIACQNAMPEVKKLGEIFKDDKDIQIATMDATTNEVLKITIVDVPTIMLFVKGNRKPVLYKEDDRSAGAFAKFIRENIKKDQESSESSKKSREGEDIKTKDEKDTEKNPVKKDIKEPTKDMNDKKSKKDSTKTENKKESKLSEKKIEKEESGKTLAGKKQKKGEKDEKSKKSEDSTNEKKSKKSKKTEKSKEKAKSKSKSKKDEL